MKIDDFFMEDNLSIHGKKAVEPIIESLQKVLYSAEMREISSQDLNKFRSLLLQELNKEIDKKLPKDKNLLNKMTDEEFYSYLKSKYGANWVLKTLTPEEFERCPDIPPEKIKETIEQGRKAARAYYEQNNYSKISNVRFR